jgi:myo-inositol-1(or 4)-monophosphatase
MLILQEAGGVFVGANPGDWEPALDGRTVLAVRGAPAGQKEIIEELWSYVVGRYDYQS